MLRQSLRLFLPWALLVCAAALAFHVVEVRRATSRLEAHEALDVGLGAATLQRAIRGISADLAYLAREGVLRTVLDDPQAANLRKLEQNYLEFARAKAVYDQVRWIDENGRERVRVNYGGGLATAVEAQELQDKSQGYYFGAAMERAAGEIYVSPLDLNIEQDKVEQPIKPMIRIATPVFDSSGRRRGIVILNYLARDMLDRFRAMTAHIADHVYLINAEGYTLLSPQPENDWGFMFGRGPQFPQRHGGAWQALRLAPQGQFSDADGLWTFAAVAPLAEARSSGPVVSPAADGAARQPYAWRVVAWLPQSQIAAVTRDTERELIAATLLLLAAGAFGAGRLARARLQREAAQAELRRANASLEQRVAQRARELEIEAQERQRAQERAAAQAERNAAIVAISADGFFLLDRSGRIRDANPAYSRLSGYTRDELLAMSVADLEAAHDPEQIAGRIDEIVRGGELRFESRHRAKDGRLVDVDISAAYLPAPEVIVAFMRDITDRRHTERVREARLRLSAYATHHSLHELLVATLDEAAALTDSAIGFYHFLDADQRTLSLQAWSTRTTREFCRTQAEGRHYDLDQAGVWVDCVRERRPVIHNDYASLPHRKGLPPGHAQVRREMVVPVFRERRIVALLGVGNKDQDYTAADLDVVSQLADLAWDIVERKRAEEALLESEARYRTLIANVPWAVYRSEVKAPWRMTVMSEGVKSVTGHAAAAFLDPLAPLMWASLVLEQDLPVLERAVAQAVAERRPYSVEYRIMAADGSVRWLQEDGRAAYADDGRPLWLDGVIGDISERKRVESDLRESERRFRETLDNIDLIAIALDLEGRLAYCNQHFLRISGWSREEAMGTSWFDRFIAQESGAEIRALFLGAVREDRVPIHHENEFVTRSGQRRLVRWTNTLMRDGNGRVTGAVSLGEDVTERRRAEDEVRRLNDSLEQRVAERTTALTSAMKELEAFSYSASHDLRTPLRGISGFSALLEDEYSELLDAQGHDYLKRIRSGAQRMAQLIDDMLDLAQVSRHALQRQRVDLAEIAHDVDGELRRATPGRAVTLEVAGELWVDADPALLRRLLGHLLQNAWKFTARCPAPLVSIGSVPTESGTTYFVRDNGAGFDMRYADRLFRPFQRLHGPTEFEGNGIGLAIVQRIAQRHGGKAWIEAAPNQGATVYFTLAPAIPALE